MKTITLIFSILLLASTMALASGVSADRTDFLKKYDPKGEKDPQSYVKRYNTEPKYKAWFDKNWGKKYKNIYEAVGLPKSKNSQKQPIICGSGTMLKDGICIVDSSYRKQEQKQPNNIKPSQPSNSNQILDFFKPKPSKYDGLTEQQTNHVKQIENTCKDNSAMLSLLGGEKAEKIYGQRCDEKVQQVISDYRLKNTTDLAIQNHDAKICTSLEYPDGCIFSYIEKYDEIQACSILDNESYCLNYFTTKKAITTKNPSLCNSLKDNTACIISYAERFGEPKLCKLTKNSDSCLEQLVPSLGGDACNLMSSDKIKKCKIDYINSKFTMRAMDGLDNELYLNNDIQKQCGGLNNWYISMSPIRLISCSIHRTQLIGIDGDFLLEIVNQQPLCNKNYPQCPYGDIENWRHANQTSFCEKAISPALVQTTEERPSMCIAAIATYSNNLSICDKAEAARGKCYVEFALTNDSVSLKTCDTINNEQDRIHCYQNVAARLNDTSICELPIMMNPEAGATRESRPVHEYMDNYDCLNRITSLNEWKKSK